MQIVIAWVSEDCVMVQEGHPDIGRPHKFKAVPKPMACMWLGNGKASDIPKAKKFAAASGYKVFTYSGEKDPLGKAREDILK